MKKGKVYLVGAGPGDAGLTAIDGRNLLMDADVVMHDALICTNILNNTKPNVELIPVGKRAGKHTLQQEEINKLIVEKAKEGKIVVRLKGGDPYVFGRGSEEALYCQENGVDFEVVPGITSAFAAACYAGIPVTQRGMATSVAVVTGHTKDGDAPINIPNTDTVIFLMSVSNIGKIIDTLIADGWGEDTPIAAVEHGTWYDQRTVKGTIGNFMQVIDKTPLRTPAIFVVGEVVNLNDKLDWFSKKPRILTLGRSPHLYQYLGTIVNRQLIDCVDSEDYTDSLEAIERLGEFDWLVFTSSNGVGYFFSRMLMKGYDARKLAHLKIAVIGKMTAGTLMGVGLNADLCAKTESSEGLLEEFKKNDLKNKKVLLPQAMDASNVLPKGLEKMGAKVTKIAVYKTIEKECEDVDFNYIDKVLFTSGSTVRAFVKRFGKLPEHVKAICLGKPTQAVAKEHGIDAEILPKDQRYYY